MNIPYDGIQGQDSFEGKRVKIDYGGREIIMGEEEIEFDEDEQSAGQTKEIWVILKARCEIIVGVPTDSPEPETGLIGKRELAPRVIVAESLNTVCDGTCLTSILNTTSQETRISLPTVKLEQCQEEAKQTAAQTCCGAEVADYKHVPDTTAEPSCHFRLLHRTQGEYLSSRPM
jgi:hypothetical protein